MLPVREFARLAFALTGCSFLTVAQAYEEFIASSLPNFLAGYSGAHLQVFLEYYGALSQSLFGAAAPRCACTLFRAELDVWG